MGTSATLCFIGTGASSGVPMIGCQCGTCQSKNPKNQRLRTSAWIAIGPTNLLIDASPDMRLQALRYSIPIPDALLITHTHFDHIGGLEELRAYNVHHKRSIPCDLSSESFNNIKKLFYYYFEGDGFCASFNFHVLPPPPSEFSIGTTTISTVEYTQGPMGVTGYRIGSLAYVTDIKQYDPSLFDRLRNLDVLVLSAVWTTSTKMQLSLEEALEFQKKVGAKQTYLTHLSHDIDYEAVSAALPKGVALAYDGLSVSFSY